MIRDEIKKKNNKKIRTKLDKKTKWNKMPKGEIEKNIKSKKNIVKKKKQWPKLIGMKSQGHN